MTSDNTDQRKARTIVILPKPAWDAYFDAHQIFVDGHVAVLMLPSQVYLVRETNFSADGTRVAGSHDFTFDDILAMRDWFGSVELRKELPSDWDTTERQ